MKRLLYTIALLGGLFAAFYFLGNRLLHHLALKGVERAIPRLAGQGITIDTLGFRRVRMVSWRALAIDDLVLRFRLEREFMGQRSFRSELQAERVIARVSSFRIPSVTGILDEFSLLLEYDDPVRVESSPYGRFEHARFETSTAIDLSDPIESFRRLSADLNTLFRENAVAAPFTLRGTVFFSLAGKSSSARLFTEHRDGLTRLRLEADDLLRAARDFGVELTLAEAELIAGFPAQVPALIKITRDAERRSEHLGAADPAFPRDAWKHVYWSYQLTRAFGPEFARRVTDAHELKPNNTLEEREMDYHNNRLAREYAREELTEQQLLRKFLADPSVIRTPQDGGP
jgi:hypothetical protein